MTWRRPESQRTMIESMVVVLPKPNYTGSDGCDICPEPPPTPTKRSRSPS